MNIFNFISILFIILLVIAIIILKKKLDIIVNRIDRFDRPSLNRDINYIILGLYLLSFLRRRLFAPRQRQGKQGEEG